MTITRCHYVLCGCFIWFDIRWDVYENFLRARMEIAKKLGATFMYDEIITG